jgi:hypothetical protein
MAKDYTRHQQGIIKRYYEHRDTIRTERLSQTVSDLYLCESPTKAAKLWKSAADNLRQISSNPVWLQRIDRAVTEKDINRLAELVAEVDAMPPADPKGKR